MAFAIEVEEWVGSVWHRFITRRASPDFPEARVELESMRRPLSVLFRAMGGASGVGVEAANARDLMLRRNLLPVLSLDPHAAKNGGQYSIRSLYFDTAEDDSLYEKMSGIYYRQKYRSRIYPYSDAAIFL